MLECTGDFARGGPFVDFLDVEAMQMSMCG